MAMTKRERKARIAAPMAKLDARLKGMSPEERLAAEAEGR